MARMRKVQVTVMAHDVKRETICPKLIMAKLDERPERLLACPFSGYGHLLVQFF